MIPLQSQVEGATLEQVQAMGLIGYCLAVKLPEHIQAPKQRKAGRANNRYDLVAYCGNFPEPMQGLWHKMNQQGQALYFRYKPLANTKFNTRMQYSLEIGGANNFTSLEPVSIESLFYIGTPDKADNAGSMLRFATYLIRMGRYKGMDAIEVLCLTAQNAREYMHLYRAGELEELICGVRANAIHLRWQEVNSTFAEWWQELHNGQGENEQPSQPRA